VRPFPDPERHSKVEPHEEQAHMHVGLIGSAMHGIDEPFAGGLEAHVATLRRRLLARGHRVTILPGGPHRFVPSDNASRDISATSPAAIFEHHAYLASLVDLPDDLSVLHNHSLHYLPVALAPALAPPMVTTLHSPPTQWLESAFVAARRRTGPVVSVSRANSAQWRRSVRPCGVVPNGVDLETFRPGKGGGGHAAWTGRIVPEKGLLSAIEATRIAGTSLRFAGPVQDPVHFERDIVPLLGSDVVYEGHLDRAGLNQLVGSADVTLATPHWEEPYGLVVAESLAMGTPVAAYRRGGIPEILDSSSGRLAPPGDVEQLGAALGAARALDRAECRRRAEEHCDAEQMVERYEALYELAMRRRPWRP
jgi:glycosyltransferase involved in cell wall biosynthesis